MMMFFSNNLVDCLTISRKNQWFSSISTIKFLNNWSLSANMMLKPWKKVVSYKKKFLLTSLEKIKYVENLQQKSLFILVEEEILNKYSNSCLCKIAKSKKNRSIQIHNAILRWICLVTPCMSLAKNRKAVLQ